MKKNHLFNFELVIHCLMQFDFNWILTNLIERKGKGTINHFLSFQPYLAYSWLENLLENWLKGAKYDHKTLF